MKKSELQDKAYMVATGQFLFDEMTYDEFQDTNCVDTVLDIYSHYGERELVDAIVQLADSIMWNFKEFIDDVDI